MSTDDRPGRRAIIKAGVAGSVALATFPAGCGDGASVPRGPIAAGNTADVAVDTLTLVPGGYVLLGRDADGLFAMTAVCTHAGCIVQAPAGATGGPSCLCHGSLFDRNGGVVRGPAGSPLRHYQVDVAADGSITIQGGMTVDAGVRTAV
jgi:Rieske Fe-S protein